MSGGDMLLGATARPNGVLTELLAVRSGIDVAVDDGFLVMTDGHVRSRVPMRDAGLTAAMTRLSEGPATEDELFDVALGSGGDASALSLPLVMRRLESGGWISHRVIDTGGDLAIGTEPRGHALVVATRRVVATSVMEMSDHCLIRRVDGVVTAESPLTGWDLTVFDVAWTTALLSFDGGQTVDEVAASTAMSSPDLVIVANQALRAGVLRFVDEPVAHGLELWSLPDLWFHSMSRVGVHRGGYGGTYHQEGHLEPEPAIRPRVVDDPDRWHPFPAIDLDAVGAADPPFGVVVRQRRSIREHDDSRPITRDELGQLLGRVGAVQTCVDDGHQELSFRQVPSGGALHELEIYPLVHLCDGLEPGLYHYDAAVHGLELIRAADSQTRLLLEYAQRTSTMATPPQVSILVAARFGRAMWKYESMAYALILKHVGVLYEALYLTATAMGLACCALGGGNSQAFAGATGLAPHLEGSVGEFVVGSRPASTVEVELPGST